MANINTRIDYFPEEQKASGAHSLPEQLRLTAIKMLKGIGKADETRRTLRRRRYASLLGNSR
jgi:hypothetical protein